MKYKTRRLVMNKDLNPNGTLFGGQLLSWIDEEAAIFAICQLKTENIVTKIISEINFVSPGYIGDVVEIGLEVIKFGKTSITLKCVVRNRNSGKNIVTVDKIIFVSMGKDGSPSPHGVVMSKTI